MIQVENLNKDYGSFRALNNISFQIEKGELVGLLGPNGAGKTTLMRIITGFIPATYGTVTVGGQDIFNNPKEAKRLIGYLPENCPLYPEMTVKDFLTSLAELRGIQAKDLKGRLDYVLEAVKITSKQNSIIATLSKGYKQRVGLAQSLIHDPEVLILDEPTVGLDPNQIIEIRELIISLKKERTIVLSTHILPEISQICERIMIIANGSLVAQKTESELIKEFTNDHKIFVQVRGDMERAVTVIKSVEGVQKAFISENGVIEVHFEQNQEIRPLIAKKLIENNLELIELRGKKMSLEEIFIKLTQAQ